MIYFKPAGSKLCMNTMSVNFIWNACMVKDVVYLSSYSTPVKPRCKSMADKNNYGMLCVLSKLLRLSLCMTSYIEL